MLIPNMIPKNCHMYIFVVFCLHVTKSKQISKIIVATCSQGLYGVIEYADSEYDTKYKFQHVVFAAAQREQAKRASIYYILMRIISMHYHRISFYLF